MSKTPGKFAIDAILCDSCIVADGKLYIQGGGWEAIGSTIYPFAVSRIGLALVLEVPWNETNRGHSLTIRLEGEGEGEEPVQVPIGPSARDTEGNIHREPTILAQFTAGRPPNLASGDSQKMPLAINLDQLVFSSPGLHSFVIEVNGTELNRLSFRIMGPSGINLGFSGRG